MGIKFIYWFNEFESSVIIVMTEFCYGIKKTVRFNFNDSDLHDRR
jgi:hypothetical protein